jgi:DNA-3-methyladenine glycosylase II
MSPWGSVRACSRPMYDDAQRRLAAVDPIMGELIARVGPCQLEPDYARTPFQALIRAVAYQQLHGKAAATILGRFLDLYKPARFPTAQAIIDTPLAALTGVGFSRPKATYIHEIAQRALEGVVPDRKEIGRMSDEEIIARLTRIKGVGRWTVEMLLIFTLGRLDVLPVDDLGVRNGFAIAYRKRKLPDATQLRRHGQRWQPYRSVASWYLWRAVDQGSD